MSAPLPPAAEMWARTNVESNTWIAVWIPHADMELAVDGSGRWQLSRDRLGCFDFIEPGLEMQLHPALDFGEANSLVGEIEHEVRDLAVLGAEQRPVHESIVEIGVAHESCLGHRYDTRDH